MRLLEHRRHSLREAGTPHLSPRGVELARRVGATIGPFDRVVTSPKPRAVETAIELGLRVDAEVPELGTMPDDAGVPIEPGALGSFAEYAELFHRSRIAAQYGREQLAVWLRELDRLPDGGRLLLVSHGGLIEFGAAAALGTRIATWGPVLGPLDGVRIVRHGSRWIRGEVVRASPPGSR